MDINENQPLGQDDPLDHLQISLQHQKDSWKRMENSLVTLKWAVAAMFIIMMVMFLWILTRMNHAEESILIHSMEIRILYKLEAIWVLLYAVGVTWIMWKVFSISCDTLLSWCAERKPTGNHVSWSDEHNK